MKKLWVFLMASAFLFSSSVFATIINIPGDYDTIQEGIDASSDGDTVLVQPGTYVENINFNGHNIVLGSLFLTTEDTSYISATVIDGDSLGSVVTFESGEDSTATIMGFTIQNGFGAGGGISCSDSNPLIINNIITANSANYGGGINCSDDSNPVIADNIITANFAYYGGGGISVGHSHPIIVRNMINENWSGSIGGGIFCNISNPIITNCVISENSCGEYGGGIFCLQRSSPTIANSVIFGNYAIENGGGIACADNSSPVVTNSVFWADIPYEIFFEYGSYPVFTYCDIQDWWDGEGNIYANPLFRNPENGDFHLMSTACGDSLDSPCIDAGSPAIIDSVLDCSWGLGTILSDMGAFGGSDSVMVGIDDYEFPVPKQMALFQNYPNPFNAATILNYMLPQSGAVTISVYNLLGQRVATIFEGDQQAGQHTITWDATDFPTGVYFARLKAGEYSESMKMVLLK